MKDEWLVHPNRWAAAPARPRPTSLGTSIAPAMSGGVHTPDMTRECILVLPLPERYRRRRTKDGLVVFGDSSWGLVVASAHGLAQSVDKDAPRFGIKYPWDEQYQWWDGASTDEDRRAGADAADYIRPWLERIFPDATGPMQIIDQRSFVGT